MRCTLLLCIFLSTYALAWDNHALLTHWIAQGIPEVRDAPSVTVESLDDFLKDAGPHLIDQLRINPHYPFALFLQIMPRQLAGSTLLDPKSISLLPRDLAPTERFVGVKKGQLVRPLDVLASASDEPDYGMDIHLFEDNGTTFGKADGFGKQPFGNPALELNSQAPFHMGFFHESRLLNWAAPELKRTFVTLRIEQYLKLSRLAFARHHPYWGWRFMGFGLHYIQDLAQPYHTTVLPGVSTFTLVGASLLDAIGVKGPKKSIIQRASDEHLLLEKLVYEAIVKAMLQKEDPARMLLVLAEPTPTAPITQVRDFVWNQLSQQSHDHASAVADVLHRLDNQHQDPLLYAKTTLQTLMRETSQFSHRWITTCLKGS